MNQLDTKKPRLTTDVHQQQQQLQQPTQILQIQPSSNHVLQAQQSYYHPHHLSPIAAVSTASTTSSTIDSIVPAAHHLNTVYNPHNFTLTNPHQMPAHHQTQQSQQQLSSEEVAFNYFDHLRRPRW
jgi:hypothetical protein